MTHTYRLAERNIDITSLYGDVHRICADYRVDGEPDFAVEITQADIDYERSRATVAADDGYLETLAVYRKIAERMPAYGTMLMHGSCVSVDGAAYLFTAKSGTGKSTHTRSWREMLGERAVMVNDDKPLVRVSDGGAVVFGTPWDGKHHLSSNIRVPLRAVCVLERAEENSIRAAEAREVYPLLLQQVYRPADTVMLQRTLELIDKLIVSVGLWRLGCNMEPDAARISYEAMKRKEN